MSVLREIAQKVKELLDDLETLEQQEKTTGFEYPFVVGDECFFINVAGEPVQHKWSNCVHQKHAYRQGNFFKTRKEAERERDKRELLMRFKQFRDKCNGDWKADFTAHNRDKYALFFNRHHDAFFVEASATFNHFNLFGYFKNEVDAELAIELFGDEIKRLWVDE